jgi:hypothetical protein
MNKLFVTVLAACAAFVGQITQASIEGGVVIPQIPQVEKRVVPAEEVIKLQVMDKRVIAYTVDHTWVSSGHRFALVKAVRQIETKYKEDGSSSSKVTSDVNPIIVKVPMRLPASITDQGFTGMICIDHDGKIATFHPVTRKIVPYE